VGSALVTSSFVEHDCDHFFPGKLLIIFFPFFPFLEVRALAFSFFGNFVVVGGRTSEVRRNERTKKKQKQKINGKNLRGWSRDYDSSGI